MMGARDEDAERYRSLLFNLQRMVWSNDGKEYPDQRLHWLDQAGNSIEKPWAAKPRLMQLVALGFDRKIVDEEPL